MLYIYIHCKTLQTSRLPTSVGVEKLLPLIKSGCPFRRPINLNICPGEVPWLHGYGRNARVVDKYLGFLQEYPREKLLHIS